MGAAAKERIAAVSLRKLRLVSGLLLFFYVGSHLLNHTLGNISLPAMEAGLLVQKWLWQGIAGTTLLYGALSVHFVLGMWALYERRHFGWTRAEIVQVILGLLIPFLLMNHLFVTRIALLQFGLQKGYAQELYSLWVAAPDLGVLQVCVLIVAWIHGCIGITMWLQLKRRFEQLKAFLLCGGIILPTLALLGFFQGGKIVRAAVHDPAWRAANLAPWQIGMPAANASLLLERNISLLVALGLVVLVLLGRLLRAWRERRGHIVRVSYPDGRIARVPPGFSVLEASRSARIPHASVCGGRGRCSTCRIRVIAASGIIPRPSAVEQGVLDRIGAGNLVRLACQLRPGGDIAVVPLLPPHFSAAALRSRVPPQPGEERFIAVLVADMRNSSRLAQTRLPFDAVFIIDRFINAIGAAVIASGGIPNQFTGDGLLAMFGLNCDPDTACRQALDAVSRIGGNIAALNRALLAEIGEPIAFGIGVHGSNAVVGEIGYAQSRVFTTLGDAANTASRLEALCKPLGCEAVISHEVLARSGAALSGFTRHDVAVRGREAALVVYTIDTIVGSPSPAPKG